MPAYQSLPLIAAALLFAFVPYLLFRTFFYSFFDKNYKFFEFWGIVVAPAASLGIRSAFLLDPILADIPSEYAVVFSAPIAEEIAKLCGIGILVWNMRVRVNVFAAAILVGYAFGAGENLTYFLSYDWTGGGEVPIWVMMRTFITAPFHVGLVLISSRFLLTPSTWPAGLSMAIAFHSGFNWIAINGDLYGDTGMTVQILYAVAIALTAVLLWAHVFMFYGWRGAEICHPALKDK